MITKLIINIFIFLLKNELIIKGISRHEHSSGVFTFTVLILDILSLGMWYQISGMKFIIFDTIPSGGHDLQFDNEPVQTEDTLEHCK